QAKDPRELAVHRHVVVIGGGNTAVDIAIQKKKLGAELVTMAYRRGHENMGATKHEQELAQKNGVPHKTWVKPVKITGNGQGTKIEHIEFEYTELKDGKLQGKGQFLTLPAQQFFKAIGQKLVPDALKGLEIA